MATDPVCQMQVDEKTAPARATYEGKTYYFCSTECKDMFLKEPKKYTNQAAATR